MPLDVTQPPPFSVTQEPSSVASRWKKWIKSFKFYLEATGITNAVQKRALLLHVVGPEIQEIFSTLPEPLDTLELVLTVLETYFSPQVNIRYERVLFRQIKQESGETTDSYVTRLRKLAETCEFHDADDAILDQVIEKCYSSELRRKALQEKNLTLDKLLQLARAMEAANRQANIIEGNGSSNKQISKVQHEKPGKKAYSNNRQSKPDIKKNKTTEYKPQSCGTCGSSKHTYYDLQNCPAKDKKCLGCGKLNHFRQYCKAKKHVYNTSELNSSATTQRDSQADEFNDANFAFALNTNKDVKRRIVLNVQVNGKLILMQLDTAPDVSVVSEEVARTIPEMTVSTCDHPLIDYNGEKIPVLGIAKVGVSYKGKEYKYLPLTVVKGQRQSLFGLDWIGKVTLQIDLDNYNIHKVQNVQPEESLSKLLEKHNAIFDDNLGTVKGVTASLLLKADANPKFCPPRHTFCLKTTGRTGNSEIN